MDNKRRNLGEGLGVRKLKGMVLERSKAWCYSSVSANEGSKKKKKKWVRWPRVRVQMKLEEKDKTEIFCLIRE